MTQTTSFDQALEVGGRTDPGRVRPRNEDHFVVADLDRLASVRETSLQRDRAPTRISAQGTVLMVADGIGGHGSGDVASSVALDAMVSDLATALPWFPRDGGAPAHSDEMAGELAAALLRCQAKLEDVAGRQGLDPRMGTTLTMAWILPPTVYVVHAGDSRCYLWREGKLERLTTDHTAAEQLRGLPGRDPAGDERLRHVLVNAVGGGSRELRAEFHERELASGDRLLLCTDGLTNLVDDGEIAELVALDEPVASICDRLVDTALARGGTDNVTAVLARVPQA